MILFRTSAEPFFENYKVGDLISFELGNGESAEALGIKDEGDGVIFVFVDCLKREYPMNTERRDGGYAKSSLRNVLNSDVLHLFPYEIRNQMVPFESGDLVRIPTARELFGNEVYDRGENAQWTLMEDLRNRIAYAGFRSKLWTCYWLQDTTVRSSSVFFDVVTSTGERSNCIAVTSLGVRPVFKLKR